MVSFEKTYVEKTTEGSGVTPWVAGQVTPYTIDKENGLATWRKVEKIVPPQLKTLDESRGYVIADYQDFLEKAWIVQLEKEFPITVNHLVFESLVKK